jgi:iron complex transport system ATP-binding protein
VVGAITVQDGRFTYGGRDDVFHGLSFDVNQGDLLSILGPNGCGKTTLLRCMSGALRMQGGRVLLDGQDVARLDSTQIAQRIGFVFQEHTVVFPFTVLQVVSMGRTPYLGLFSAPSPKDIGIAEDSLHIVGIWHLRDKPYSQISGGERQLALIARALTQEPQILLLDEPTSHLDFGNQVLMLRIIRQLVEHRGLCVVMATHFPNHAVLVSTKVALMKGGRMDPPGAPDQVMTEESLRRLYGVAVKVVSLGGEGANGRARVVIPLMDADEE